MPILLNDNLDISAPRPTDNRYGPYLTIASALSSVTRANRYVGLTVGIMIGSIVVDYWFNGGTADNDLALKVSDSKYATQFVLMGA